ncbi:MAG: 1-acyl-sn-glycerol-3-phosphate acyltransferase, partial [Ruminiclostridium sp.]|nr:1-acyl-sn-glycerol-3-phosphate acyltransferase [Ruminiclostridium sp.]
MYYFFRAILSLVFHIRYRINIIHRENIPDMKGGFIIAANHQRYADPPMISVIKSAKYSFMAKEELFKKNRLF